MVKREQIERIELLVEPLSYAAPSPADHLRAARRVWAATQRTAHVVAAERMESAASSPCDAPVTPFTRSTTFRRLIDVPGACLDTVLDAWWARASHDDGHLRLDGFSRDHGLFELDGSLRTSPLARRIAVQVRLSPYLGRWSFLELTPQRPTHASRIYFRTGHDSLDRFVAALGALV